MKLKYFLIIIIMIELKTAQNLAVDYKYHSYESMTEILRNFNQNFPNKTCLYSIGKTVEGRDLWVLAIADSNPSVHMKLRPEAKYIGNMHGNEAITQEVLLHLLDYLLNNQMNDPNVDFILKNTRVHIMPSMNPDGYEEANVGDCQSLDGRYNANNVDLNRNFPDLFECNDKIVLQPEANSVVNWLENNFFILSANLHSGAVVVNYPFDDYLNSKIENLPKESICSDNDVFINISLNYSFSHPNMRYSPCNNSKEVFIDGITNGAAWYPTSGGMQDFNYWKFGCYEVSLEISCCNYPPASEIEKNWLENKNSLVEYLKIANTGIRGLITYNNGEPAKFVSVAIDSREPLFKTNENGEYYRILLPGNYSLHVSINCGPHIYHTSFELKTNLLEMNITLWVNESQEHSHHLNRYPIFCVTNPVPKCSTDQHHNLGSANNEFNFYLTVLSFIMIFVNLCI